MTTITIKYTNYMPSFKQIHDLIMDNEGCIVEFEEMDDGVNPSSVFIIANLLFTCNICASTFFVSR